MPGRLKKVPAYCHHKASGRAVVRIEGKDVYLGEFGSAESHRRYEAVLQEWRAGLPRGSSGPRYLITIAELILKYKEFATEYYSWEGRPTGELQTIRYSLRILRQLYADLPASEFGPKALKTVRSAMIEAGWCRQLVNRRVYRIKRFIKWAVSEELVPGSVLEALRSVDGLQQGRCNAREAPPVVPVPDADINGTLPYLSPQVAAMVRLQRLTGMRPGEVIQVRPAEIDRSSDVWIFTPIQHKNRWRGGRRVIALGPEAQQTLHPFLDRSATDYCFQPREAEAWRNQERRRVAESPRNPSQMRPAQASKRKPPSEQYTVDSYRRAVDYGIAKANRNGGSVPHWHPNQLRHTRATEIRKRFGLEAAQVALGHAHAAITEVYAERDQDRAAEIARQSG
jgi:integrase